MTTKQAQKILDELKGAKPEELKGEAKRLFEAIMKIADERDELKEKIKDKIEKLKNNKENYIFEKLTSEDIKRTIITNLQKILEK